VTNLNYQGIVLRSPWVSISFSS